ncbi:helix-turn-helix domain-containing protein [Thermoplasma acidophilum]
MIIIYLPITILTAARVRIYPYEVFKENLERHFAVCRFVHNHFL